MDRFWEEGDMIFTRRFREEDLEGRDHIFQILTKDPGPFMEIKRTRWSEGSGDYWDVYYRGEGCWMFHTWLSMNMYRNRLEMQGYLKAMYRILTAMEEAEERMIMTASFEISADTIWYHEEEDRVKFMYIPVSDKIGSKDLSLWINRSAPKLLLELLEEVRKRDLGFLERWPHLQSTYQEWDEKNAGRNYCMKQIRSWYREFPEKRSERIEERYLDHYQKDTKEPDVFETQKQLV
ncbi:MAG: hypothetical protein IKD13_05035 [Firmicutes bacterium]|nr:hypothetical protein [Bacillota bacterium]